LGSGRSHEQPRKGCASAQGSQRASLADRGGEASDRRGQANPRDSRRWEPAQQLTSSFLRPGARHRATGLLVGDQTMLSAESTVVARPGASTLPPASSLVDSTSKPQSYTTQDLSNRTNR